METTTTTSQSTIDEMIERITYIDNLIATPFLANDYTEDELDSLADVAYELRELLHEMGVEA
jgi:hypothetical protein